jgi:tetratricopeptide (TPR) repeat protein
MGRFDEATTLLKQIEAQEPAFSSSHSYLAGIHVYLKEYAAYLTEARVAATLTQDSQGLAIVAAGDKGFAAGGGQAMLESILAVERQFYAKDRLPAYALARTYGRLGQKGEALSYLRASLERAEPALVSLRVDEAIDCVRDDPAYQEIVPLRPGRAPVRGRPGLFWRCPGPSRPITALIPKRESGSRLTPGGGWRRPTKRRKSRRIPDTRTKNL